MKKMLMILLSLTLILALTAGGCLAESDAQTGASTSDNAAQAADSETSETDTNILIAYFSWSGNTEAVAQIIAEQTGGDLFAIEPATPYTDDYDELLDVARQEQSEDARPELAAQVENWADYDVIFVGYPNWLAYTAIADVDIMDENGSMTLPVEGGTVLTENYVGANLANYDFLVVLSHFKGHAMAGFGGAIKNLSIGCASSEGKAWIHSGGTGGSMWGGEQDAFLEAMAEAAKSVVDYFGNGERALYINVMNRLSVDCDCDGSPAEPDMRDIGILASTDPVALDQACIDLVYAAEDSASLVQRIESRNGLHTLEHTQDIGFGSREYALVSIDE